MNEGVWTYGNSPKIQGTPAPEEQDNKISGHRPVGQQFTGSLVEESPASVQEVSQRVDVLSEKLPAPPNWALPVPPHTNHLDLPPLTNVPLPPTPKPPVPDRALKPALKPRPGSPDQALPNSESPASDQVKKQEAHPLPPMKQVKEASPKMQKFRDFLSAAGQKISNTYKQFISTPMSHQRMGARKETVNAESKQPSSGAKAINEHIETLKKKEAEEIAAQIKPPVEETAEEKAIREENDKIIARLAGDEDEKTLEQRATEASEHAETLIKDHDVKGFVNLVFTPGISHLTKNELLNSYKYKMTSRELLDGIHSNLHSASPAKRDEMLNFVTMWVQHKAFSSELRDMRQPIEAIIQDMKSSNLPTSYTKRLEKALKDRLEEIQTPLPAQLVEKKKALSTEQIIKMIKRGKYSKTFPDEFAEILKQKSGEAHRNLDLTEILTKELDKVSSETVTFNATLKQAADLTNGISHEVLQEQDPKVRQRILTFYAKVANASVEKGDFNSALAIYLALTKPSVERLHNDVEGKKNLNELFAMDFNYKNLANATQAYKDQHPDGPPPIPPAFMIPRSLTGAKQNLFLSKFRVFSTIVTPLMEAKNSKPLPVTQNADAALKLFEINYEQYADKASSKTPEEQFEKRLDELSQAIKPRGR